MLWFPFSFWAKATSYEINHPSPVGGRCHEVTDEGCGHLAAVTQVETIPVEF